MLELESSVLVTNTANPKDLTTSTLSTLIPLHAITLSFLTASITSTRKGAVLARIVL